MEDCGSSRPEVALRLGEAVRNAWNRGPCHPLCSYQRGLFFKKPLSYVHCSMQRAIEAPARYMIFLFLFADSACYSYVILFADRHTQSP